MVQAYGRVSLVFEQFVQKQDIPCVVVSMTLGKKDRHRCLS